MRIKTGDKVQVLWGKDKGKTGKVLQIFSDRNKASVEGINLMTKHLKQKRQGEKGQKIQFPSPIPMDKIMLVCPKCAKPTRVAIKILDTGKRARTCKECKETI